MTTAFQVGAFQFTGFQEGGVGSGGWVPWLLMDYRERRLAAARRKKREEERKREEEEAVATLKYPLVPLRYVARASIPPEVMARLRGRPALNVDLELADFRELMQLIADVDELV